MSKRSKDWLPRYRGEEWIEASLPDAARPWVEGKGRSLRQRNASHSENCKRLVQLASAHAWRWPKRPVCFITDVHADADALSASLVASGGIRKTGPNDADFRVTGAGRKARYVIGGDCFDKGPENLRLLRLLRRLLRRGIDLRLLAGNHDIRVMLGMRSVGKHRSETNQHFFVRMGPKAIPLIRELSEQYLEKRDLRDLPSSKQCRRLLYPAESWQENFPRLARRVLPAPVIERELEKIEKKMERFDHLCDVNDLSMKQIYAAVLKWQRLFLQPGQEFHWFYDRLRLFYRQGSFLFLHAGLDDQVASMIRDKGIGDVNRRFRKQLKDDKLAFYYGPIANTIRTKYRAADYPLTRKGVRLVHDCGIHAIIHGHRNVYHGQRISLRRNMINFECDTTMDCGSRVREGLKGAGAGVTIVHPKAQIVLGISSDYEYAKVLDPRNPCAQGSKV